MSATSELIVEEIMSLNKQIDEAIARGDDVTSLVQRLNNASQRLCNANKAINEGKQWVLKG